MKKTIKVIEICFPGCNSVLGTICNEYPEIHGATASEQNINDFCWVIFTKLQALEMVEQECKKLKLDEYIIADRGTMIVKNLK